MLLLLALLACGDKDVAADPDADGDGFPASQDCDDGDPTVNPDAVESCNGVDDDCDGQADEEAIDATVWHEDLDLDGYGDPLVTQVACDPGAGWVDETTDCDDDDATVHPGADELCDDLDNDCDDDVDEDPVDAATWYRDIDDDGYGAAADSKTACTQPSGYSALPTDCDDEDSDVYPGAPELCNDADDDCDEEIDEDPTDGYTWYVDADSDGFGNLAEPIYSCVEEPGTIAEGGDCDDGDDTVFPGAEELCGDGQVNDCEADVNDAAATCGGWGNPVAADEVASDHLVATDDAWLGATLAGALDFDDNGYDDVIVGAWDQGGAGAVHLLLHHGGADTELGTISGQYAGHGFGSEVAALGDVDGDGADELLVAATATADRGQGIVYLYPGGEVPAFGEALAVWEGDADGEIAGTEALASLGDVDGDGAPDFLVGARYGSLGGTFAGQAYVVSGALTGGQDLADATARLYSTVGYGYAAQRVAGPGDLDGDGVPDAVVDGSSDDAAWIVLGPFSGDLDLAADADLRVLDGGDQAVANITGGDVDGDGTADLLLSTTVDDTHAERGGAVFLHLGPWTADVELAEADLAIHGESDDGYLGGELALLPDLDGDGQVDLLVGTGSSMIREGSISVNGGTGRAHVFAALAGLSGSLRESDADFSFDSATSGDTFGNDVAAAGDVDGDGRTDLLIASPEATWGGGLGDAWVIRSDIAY